MSTTPTDAQLYGNPARLFPYVIEGGQMIQQTPPPPLDVDTITTLPTELAYTFPNPPGPQDPNQQRCNQQEYCDFELLQYFVGWKQSGNTVAPPSWLLQAWANAVYPFFNGTGKGFIYQGQTYNPNGKWSPF